MGDMARPTGKILVSLRALMEKSDLSGYIIPSEDAHQSEYIADVDKRRAFVSGFCGSRGMAAVTRQHAALWTDGRYFLQARREMDPNWELQKERHENTPTLAEWLALSAAGPARVGVDARHFSASAFKSLAKDLAKSKLTLVSVHDNLVDQVWADQPLPPHKPILLLPESYTGRSWQLKVASLREAMREKKAGALVISALDEVAWTLNLRGADIDYNPVFFAYLLVTLDSAVLFMDTENRGPDMDAFLSSTVDAISVRPYNDVLKELAKLRTDMRVWLPKESTSAAVAAAVGSDERQVTEPSPVAKAKSLKNPVELSGMAAAHRRDGAAHAEFLCWLEAEMASGAALDELSVAAKFEELRRCQPDFVSLSFPTISASGPHASSPHYAVDKSSNRPLSKGEVYLVDSGSQFKDGTTDVTRTVAFGEMSPFVKETYTRVLKGHLRLARLNFPVNTPGIQLDAVSRLDLWEAGLEFRHGTGHGVGHFLNVHEGPMGIGNRDPLSSREGVQENMILTIEPGYYHAGEFGIRIENVYSLVNATTPYNFEDGSYLSFHALTLVPISTELIVPALLSPEEKVWLNAYHQRCVDEVGPLLAAKPDALRWLREACKPLD